MTKPTLNVAIGAALLAGMTMLAGCGSDSSRSATTSEQVSSSPPPAYSDTSSTTIRRQ